MLLYFLSPRSLQLCDLSLNSFSLLAYLFLGKSGCRFSFGISIHMTRKNMSTIIIGVIILISVVDGMRANDLPLIVTRLTLKAPVRVGTGRGTGADGDGDGEDWRWDGVGRLPFFAMMNIVVLLIGPLAVHQCERTQRRRRGTQNNMRMRRTMGIKMNY